MSLVNKKLEAISFTTDYDEFQQLLHLNFKREADEEQISSEDNLPRILKDKTFKMSEMIVSWKYVINTDLGLEKFLLF